MTGVTLANDTTHDNIGSLPKNALGVGYTTGSGGIAWTPDDWSAFPHAVRICQDFGSDVTADILDDETGAATNANAASWVVKAQAAYRAVRRPGQRWPGVYTSLSNVTPLVNMLVTVHPSLTYVPLYIAKWDDNESADAAAILARSGPYPVIGYQFRNAGAYDLDVFSNDWLNGVAKTTRPTRVGITQLPPGLWLPGVRISDGTWHTQSADGARWDVPTAGA